MKQKFSSLRAIQNFCRDTLFYTNFQAIATLFYTNFNAKSHTFLHELSSNRYIFLHELFSLSMTTYKDQEWIRNVSAPALPHEADLGGMLQPVDKRCFLWMFDLLTLLRLHSPKYRANLYLRNTPTTAQLSKKTTKNCTVG